MKTLFSHGHSNLLRETLAEIFLMGQDLNKLTSDQLHDNKLPQESSWKQTVLMAQIPDEVIQPKQWKVSFLTV